MSAVAREHKTKMERVQYIMDLISHGRKEAEWEFLSAGQPYDCTTAIKLIAETLR